MNFNDAKEKLSGIHKLHTARDNEGETIFYKKPFSAKRLIVLTTDKKEIFELDKVTHLSLDAYGLLVQYKPVNANKMYPFPLQIIDEILVES